MAGMVTPGSRQALQCLCMPCTMMVLAHCHHPVTGASTVQAPAHIKHYGALCCALTVGITHLDNSSI